MADTPTLSEIQDAIIQSGAEWEAAENPISQLSENEQRLVLGLQPPLGEPTLDEFAAMPPLLGAPATPSKYDLRNVNGKNYITAIRDQSTCGSCVAFGCLATIEGSISWVNDVPSPVQDLSEAHLYFCHGASQQVTCASGWWPAYALAYCISPGVVDESCFSYTPHDQPCNLCSDWKKRLTKIRSINGLTAKPDDMKKWISTKGPLVVGMVVFEDFYRYTSGVYRHVIGNQVGGHCVSLIGYDDGRSCWIAKNSWGTRWGEKGFFNIRYGECSIETMTVTGVVPFIA